MISRLIAQRGVTIIELVIVVAIGAILAVIAVPSFRDLMRDMRTGSAVGLLISDLNHARGEAIKRNSGVVACVSNLDGSNCAPPDPLVVNWNWGGGWVICAAVRSDPLDPDTEMCVPGTQNLPNPIVVRPSLDPSLALTSAGRFVRFSPNSSSGAVIALNLAGTCRGIPTVRMVRVDSAGNISREACPQ
jgi:prepilin-type N-terminal cleavage/methylation domain-containing protein